MASCIKHPSLFDFPSGLGTLQGETGLLVGPSPASRRHATDRTDVMVRMKRGQNDETRWLRGRIMSYAYRIYLPESDARLVHPASVACPCLPPSESTSCQPVFFGQ